MVTDETWMSVSWTRPTMAHLYPSWVSQFWKSHDGSRRIIMGPERVLTGAEQWKSMNEIVQRDGLGEIIPTSTKSSRVPFDWDCLRTRYIFRQTLLPPWRPRKMSTFEVWTMTSPRCTPGRLNDWGRSLARFESRRRACMNFLFFGPSKSGRTRRISRRMS